jgi:hypothetical protein
MAINPCPNPRDYSATNGRNDYTVSVQITDAIWRSVPPSEQDLVVNVLNSPKLSIMPDLKSKGNGIKRESNGWSIHTQTDKSLYDTNIRQGDAGKKVFKFDAYKKRPH